MNSRDSFSHFLTAFIRDGMQPLSPTAVQNAVKDTRKFVTAAKTQIGLVGRVLNSYPIIHNDIHAVDPQTLQTWFMECYQLCKQIQLEVDEKEFTLKQSDGETKKIKKPIVEIKNDADKRQSNQIKSIVRAILLRGCEELFNAKFELRPSIKKDLNLDPLLRTKESDKEINEHILWSYFSQIAIAPLTVFLNKQYQSDDPSDTEALDTFNKNAGLLLKLMQACYLEDTIAKDEKKNETVETRRSQLCLDTIAEYKTNCTAHEKKQSDREFLLEETVNTLTQIPIEEIKKVSILVKHDLETAAQLDQQFSENKLEQKTTMLSERINFWIGILETFETRNKTISNDHFVLCAQTMFFDGMRDYIDANNDHFKMFREDSTLYQFIANVKMSDPTAAATTKTAAAAKAITQPTAARDEKNNSSIEKLNDTLKMCHRVFLINHFLFTIEFQKKSTDTMTAWVKEKRDSYFFMKRMDSTAIFELFSKIAPLEKADATTPIALEYKHMIELSTCVRNITVNTITQVPPEKELLKKVSIMVKRDLEIARRYDQQFAARQLEEKEKKNAMLSERVIFWMGVLQLFEARNKTTPHVNHALRAHAIFEGMTNYLDNNATFQTSSLYQFIHATAAPTTTAQLTLLPSDTKNAATAAQATSLPLPDTKDQPSAATATAIKTATADDKESNEQLEKLNIILATSHRDFLIHHFLTTLNKKKSTDAMTAWVKEKREASFFMRHMGFIEIFESFSKDAPPEGVPEFNSLILQYKGMIDFATCIRNMLVQSQPEREGLTKIVSDEKILKELFLQLGLLNGSIKRTLFTRHVETYKKQHEKLKTIITHDEKSWLIQLKSHEETREEIFSILIDLTKKSVFRFAAPKKQTSPLKERYLAVCASDNFDPNIAFIDRRQVLIETFSNQDNWRPLFKAKSLQANSLLRATAGHSRNSSTSSITVAASASSTPPTPIDGTPTKPPIKETHSAPVTPRINGSPSMNGHSLLQMHATAPSDPTNSHTAAATSIAPPTK